MTKRRMIYLDDALNAVNVGNLHPGIVDALQDIISELPSAQPDIVRCKDCIHFHEDVFGDEIGLGKPYDNLIVGHNGCGRLAPKGDMIYVSQDGYCYLAEKKWSFRIQGEKEK